MNKIIKESVENFYLTNDVTIEGKGVKTWDKEGISISLKDQNMKYITLLLSDSKYTWHIFFENETDVPMEEKEKFILLNTISNIVEKDDTIILYGNISPYDIIMLSKLKMHGFTIDGYNDISIKWNQHIDKESFNKWIEFADERLYKVIDQNKPLTI